MRILSVHEAGGKGVMVTAETNLSNGLPTMILVGFAGKSLDESRERIRSAFSSTSLSMPKRRITVNMSPSDIPKDGAHYDLAIALSILKQADMIKFPTIDVVVFGELGLDGLIKPIRGILGKLIFAIKSGYTNFIIPKENYPQASLLAGIRVLPASNLQQLCSLLAIPTNDLFVKIVNKNKDVTNQLNMTFEDFSEVIGQSTAKRALEIAAAGGHNILLNGPPGVGKSMLAKALPGIMTPLTSKEIITVTHLHSLISDTVTDLIRVRPFRAPHHSSSDVSIIGGGQNPKPGEVSLAHGGVLFLDELPEFRRSTIESLRQPLEDGLVTVARAKSSVTYPARFMLVATKNPCPCGFYGSSKPCVCTPIELQRYQKKISGPILDRIDIHVTVDNVQHQKLLEIKSGTEKSSDIKKRVEKAQQRQKIRLGSSRLNASLNNKEIKSSISLDPKAKIFMDNAAEKLNISARVYMKVIKLARTIADLDGSNTLSTAHIAEALQYRPIDTNY